MIEFAEQWRSGLIQPLSVSRRPARHRVRRYVSCGGGGDYVDDDRVEIDAVEAYWLRLLDTDAKSFDEAMLADMLEETGWQLLISSRLSGTCSAKEKWKISTPRKTVQAFRPFQEVGATAENKMTTTTTIEWTEDLKPTTGCTKVPPGCKHCYAEAMARRLQAMRVRGYENGFGLSLLPERLSEPLAGRSRPCISSIP